MRTGTGSRHHQRRVELAAPDRAAAIVPPLDAYPFVPGDNHARERKRATRGALEAEPLQDGERTRVQRIATELRSWKRARSTLARAAPARASIFARLSPPPRARDQHIKHARPGGDKLTEFHNEGTK